MNSVIRMTFRNRVFSSLLLASFVSALSVAASAESIVIVGDSISCGPFGRHLFESVSKPGDTVTLYCAVSSRPANWLEGRNPPHQICQTFSTATPNLHACAPGGQVPTFDSILKNHEGARFIVALGTNSLFNARPEEGYRQMAESLKASNHECLWIGPPHFNEGQAKGDAKKADIQMRESHLKSFYTALKSDLTPNCQLVDSRDSTLPGLPGNQTVDGIHRNETGGKFWAESIQSQIRFYTEKSAPAH